MNIDANERMASEYDRRERDRFLVAGIGEAPGVLTFREYPHHDGLSTFDGSVKALHDPVERPYVDREVEIRTLAEVFETHGISRVDFLKVDVEGLEGSVLRGADFDTVRPSVVVVEASRQDDCNAVLLPAGYHIEFFDGLNTYYVDDHADDVSIHRFAGTVLTHDYMTDAEWTLTERRRAVREHPAARAIASAAQLAPRLVHRLRRNGS